MYEFIEVITQVPWGPHYGLKLDIHADIKTVHGQVLCVPKSLPMEDFQNIWESKTNEEQNKFFKHANKGARRIFAKQKTRTGVAILGNHILN